MELSDLEIQVIKLLCDDKRSHQVATEVFRSKRTIDDIRGKLYDKLNVKGLAGLTKYAIKHGYIEL